MSLTKPSDFEKLNFLIPKNRRENVWFFPIRCNSKHPEVLRGAILKGNEQYRLTSNETSNRLQWGSNYGIYAIPGGLMFVDFDTDENGCIIASKKYREQFKKTFTVKTRSGGLHLYYLNDGLYPNQILYEGDNKIGELRTDWYYVVGCGSFCAPGQYTITRERSISEFRHVEGIRKNNETMEEKKRSSYQQRSKQISKEEYILKTKDKIRRLI